MRSIRVGSISREQYGGSSLRRFIGYKLMLPLRIRQQAPTWHTTEPTEGHSEDDSETGDSDSGSGSEAPS